MAIDRTLSASTQTGATTAATSATVTSVEQQYFASFADSGLVVETKDGLLDRIANYSHWNQQVVTYSFPTEESPDYIGNNRQGTLRPFTDNQIAAVHDVIALLEDVMNLDFQFAGTDINADTRFYNSTILNTAGGAPAGTGTDGDIWIYNYDITPPETRDYAIAKYNYHILIHELGHTLGFSHTGKFVGTTYIEKASYVQDNNAYSAMSYLLPSEAGIDWNQSYDATPMIQDILGLQYYYGANMTTRTGDTVYGFNSNITNRAPLNFDTMTANGGKVASIAIWDASGHDTIDLSGFSEDAHLDLHEAAFSNANGKEMIVSIAYGVTVEDGVTGEGNDVLVGNDVDNKLSGGDGSDTVYGGAGNDTLKGEKLFKLQAYDTKFDMVELNAATGITNQKISMAGARFGGQSFTVEFLWKQGLLQNQGYTFSLPGFSIYRYDNGAIGFKFWGATTDTWYYVSSTKMTDQQLHRVSISYDDATGKFGLYIDGALENSHNFAPGTRTLPASGDVKFNDHGQLGDVRIYNHALTAAAIKDTALITIKEPATVSGLVYNLEVNTSGSLTNTQGTSTVLTANGPTTVSGVEGFHINRNDHLYGEDGNDTLDGDAGNNELYGGAGDDTLISHEGSDLLDGGDGIDTVDYAHSIVGIIVNLNIGTGTGGDADTDEFINIENITGSLTAANTLTGNAARNILTGGERNDRINSGLGNDKIYAAAGNDIIIGGIGADQMIGGAGRDIFNFNSVKESAKKYGGIDLITDFTHRIDDIDLRTIDASARQKGNNAFTFVGTSAFHKHAGELHYKLSNKAGTVNDRTYISGDINGDGSADFMIALKGLKVLTAADFIL